MIKLLLFDLDGTLLNSQKEITGKTLEIIEWYRKQGILIGVSTSRSEPNTRNILNQLGPDLLISSSGALVTYHNVVLYKDEISAEETKRLIQIVFDLFGKDCQLSFDTVSHNYWNYKVDPTLSDQSWGESIFTDFSNFNYCTLKMCVEMPTMEMVNKLTSKLPEYDCTRFSDGNWYKFTKRSISKEKAISFITSKLGINLNDVVAFGDDYADIGMLKLCGTGIAMGNAIDEVKETADLIIGSNDEEGIANYLLEKRKSW